jgi:hypothetical protein
MQNRNDIYNELLEISRLMTEANVKSIFTKYPPIFRIICRNGDEQDKNSGCFPKNEMEMLSPILSGIDKKILIIFQKTISKLSGKNFIKNKSRACQDASEELACFLLC